MNAILEQINSAGLKFVEFALPMFVQSVVLIIILLLADFALRKKIRAVFRYWIWLLVLVKLVLPTSLSLPFSLGYFFGDRLTYVDTSETPAGPQASLAEPAPVNVPPFIDLANIEADRFTPAAQPIIPVVEPALTSSAAPPVSSVTSLSWQGAVFLTWLTVVVAMVLLLLQRAIFVRGLVAQAKEASGVMADTLESCRSSMSVKRKLGLKISANAASPAVCGLFRPVILVPQNLASSLTTDQLRAVLLHELAHIRRGDLFVNLVQTVLQIIYFYNPLLWLTNCIIRRIREQAVDEMVLVAMGEKAPQYPQTLVSVAKLAFNRPVLSLRLIGVVESKNALSGRIKHILNRPMPKKAKLGILGLLVIIIIGAILLPMASSMSGPPGLVIKGIVKNAQTGEPIAGARVFDDGYGPEPVWEQIRSDQRREWGAITNSAGQYSFLTWPEHHSIKVQAPGYKAERRSLYNGHFTFNKKDQEIFDFTLESEKVSESSEFKTTLPNGVTVELIGICEHPSEGKQWWQPDGNKLSQRPFEKLAQRVYTKREYYELVLKIENPNNRKLSIIGKSGHVFNSYSDKLWGGYVLSEGKKILNQSIGIAHGPWETIARAYPKLTQIVGDFAFGEAFESDVEGIGTAVGVTVTHTIGKEKVDYRIIAVDRKNNIHVSSGHSRLGGGSWMQTTVHFKDLHIDEIKEFQFQTRPYQWVEFKNISLKPNFKTDVQVEPETDWVIEDYGQTRLLSKKETPDIDKWVSIWGNVAKNKGRYLVPDRGLTLKDLIKAAGYSKYKLAQSYVELSRRSRQGNITACSTYSRNLKTLLSGEESDIVLKSHDSVLGGYIEPSANGVEFWSGYSFGDVVEMTVNDDGAKINMFADLDSGKLIIPPDTLDFDDENAVLRWIKDNRIDVMGETAAGVHGLIGFNMYAARVDNYFWDAVPLEFTDRLMVRIDEPVLLSVEDLLPLTYLIKTSKYKMGILQILSFVENPEGIKIRYKLLNKETAPKSDIRTIPEPVSLDWQYIGQSIPPDFNDTLILTENVNLGSIGHDAEGKTFITFVRDEERTQSWQHRFVLFNKAGDILEPDGYVVLGRGERLEEKFTFDEPFICRQLKGFRFQSRPLPPSGIDNISSQLQKGASEVVKDETLLPSNLAPPGRYAVELDGVDDYLLVPDSPSLRLESPFTIEMWVKTKLPPDASEYRSGWALISKGCYVGTPRVYLTGFGINLQRFPNEPSSLQIDFCKSNNSGTYSSTYAGYPLTNGTSEWIQITHVFEGKHYKPTPGHPLVMGKYLTSMNDPFKGLLGEVRLWNGARTRQELREYENVALRGNEPGLAACWNFEQTKGRFAYDISGNNNHARLGKSIEADDADPKWVDLQSPSHQSDLKTDAQAEIKNHLFSVYGTVTDQSGRPIAGVQLTADCGHEKLERTGRATTDENGRYTLGLTSSVKVLHVDPYDVGIQTARIEARTQGFYEASLCRQGNLAMAGKPPGPNEQRFVADYAGVVLPHKPYELNFVMRPAARIEGKLVDEWGRPILSRSVWLNSDGLLKNTYLSGSLDGNGIFTIDHVPCGTVWFKSVNRQLVQSGAVNLATPGTYRVQLQFGESPSGLTTLRIAEFQAPEPSLTESDRPRVIDPNGKPVIGKLPVLEILSMHGSGNLILDSRFGNIRLRSTKSEDWLEMKADKLHVHTNKGVRQAKQVRLTYDIKGDNEKWKKLQREFANQRKERADLEKELTELSHRSPRDIEQLRKRIGKYNEMLDAMDEAIYISIENGRLILNCPFRHRTAKAEFLDGVVRVEWHGHVVEADSITLLLGLAPVRTDGAPLPTTGWQSRFDKVYSLDDGQVLRWVRYPFIPERQIYATQKLRYYSGTDNPPPPGYLFFRWDGKLKNWLLAMHECSLGSMLRDIGLKRYEIDGSDKLLRFKLGGDLIARDNIPIEDKLLSLERILHKELGRTIRFEKRKVNRDVIIVRGQYKRIPLEGVKDSNKIYVYPNSTLGLFSGPEPFGGGGTGSLVKLVKMVGSHFNRPIVFETKNLSDTTVSYRTSSSYSHAIANTKEEDMQETLDSVL